MTDRWPTNGASYMPDRPDATILCGGAGLRLRSVIGNAPKSMAEVAGRPFLEFVLRQLRRHGFERAILAAGYQSAVIQSRLQALNCGLELLYSVESHPLGTGGALRNALGLVRSENVVVLNGDSYTDVDLAQLASTHEETKPDATIVVAPVDGRDDCGSVRLDADGRIMAFDEKKAISDVLYLNAGIYAISRHLLAEVPAGQEISLERELIPYWLRQGRRIQALICSGGCIDIGTPERYRSAQNLLAAAEMEAGEFQPRG